MSSKTMRYTRFFQISLWLVFSASMLRAQNDKALLRELAEENKKSVEALALYPSDVRLAILEASAFPEILVKMDNTRQKTAAAFRSLIANFPQSTQLTFYEIARYPGLLPQLVAAKSSPAIQELLKQLPDDQRQDAYALTQTQMRTLEKINDLDRNARSTFEDLIGGYPEPARKAFRQLVDLPEVLEILNEDLRFTVLIGDVYRTDPAWVIRKTDSLNLAVARANAEATEDWKQQIENDPEAQQELVDASREYAAEYGYVIDQDDPYDEGFYAPPVVVHHYPWWFGYPWWYTTPCWQPYPWWYNWGFRHHHQFVVIYMPSGHFMDWYFHHPRHHHRYSHVSAHFVRHYYGHRRSGTAISMTVNQWHERNRNLISDEWIKEDGRLPKRMAEYGRFEEDRQNYNGRNPKKPADQETFLNKNARKYPDLERSRTEAKVNDQRGRDRESVRPSENRDPIRSQTEPGRDPVIRPVPEKTLPNVPQEKPAQKPVVDPPKTRPTETPEAYHRRQWKDTERREAPREQAPRTQPRKEPASPKTRPSEKPGRNQKM